MAIVRYHGVGARFRLIALHLSIVLLLVVRAAYAVDTGSSKVLLYVSLFEDDSTRTFRDFTACTFADDRDAGVDPQHVLVDLLVVAAGDEPRKQEAQLRQDVLSLIDAKPYLREGHLEVLEAAEIDDRGGDGSSSNAAEQRHNAVFYNVMSAGGRLHAEFTALYDFVLHLETDVCALRPGWLGALLSAVQQGEQQDSATTTTTAPAAPTAVVLGSSIKGGCAISQPLPAPTKRPWAEVPALPPCLPAAELPDHARLALHAAAALYRTGPSLQALLDEALPDATTRGTGGDATTNNNSSGGRPTAATIPAADALPLGQALWLAARRLGGGGAIGNGNSPTDGDSPIATATPQLLDSHLVAHVARPVDAALFRDARSYPAAGGAGGGGRRGPSVVSKGNGDDAGGGRFAVLAHVPRLLRVGAADAAAAALDGSRPVTLTFASESHLPLLTQLLGSAADAALPNLLLYAFSTDLYFDLLARYGRHGPPGHPYHRLGQQEAVTAEGNGNGSGSGDGAGGGSSLGWVIARAPGVDVSGSTKYLSEQYNGVVDRKTRLAYELLQRNHSLFCVDADVVVLEDPLPLLERLPRDVLWFASEAVAATGIKHGDEAPRYFFNAGMYYIPHGEPALRFMKHWVTEQRITGGDEQDLLNEIVECYALSECAWDGVPLRPLPESTFLNGANFFSRSWPHSGAAASSAYVVHNNWADGLAAKAYRFQLAGLWRAGTPPVGPHRCATAVALGRGDAPLEVGPETAGDVAETLLRFLDYMRTERVECGVLPPMRVEGLGTLAPFDTLLDYNKALNTSGALAFYPATSWVPPVGRWLQFDPKSVPSPAKVDMELLEYHFVRPTAGHYFGHYLKQVAPYECVLDKTRSLGELAVRLHRGHVHSLLRALPAMVRGGHTALLTGQWRALGELISAAPSASPARGAAATDPPPPPATATRVSTLGRPSFPPMFLPTYGLPFAHGVWGADPTLGVLEHLVCRGGMVGEGSGAKGGGAGREEAPPPKPPAVELVDAARGGAERWDEVWNATALLVQTMRHIPRVVLLEDLGVLERHEGVRDSLRKRRHLMALEPSSEFSLMQVEASMQALLYLAKSTGGAAILPPLSLSPTEYSPASWWDVLDVDNFYSTFPYALPPSVAPLLYPSLLLEAPARQVAASAPTTPTAGGGGGGALFGAGKPQMSEAEAWHLLDLHPETASALRSMVNGYRHASTGRVAAGPHASPQRWFVTRRYGERLQLAGRFATRPSHPYLGMTDEEAAQGLAQFPRWAPVALMRAARRVRFARGNADHEAFAQAWAQGWRPSPGIVERADALAERMGGRGAYACLHMQQGVGSNQRRQQRQGRRGGQQQQQQQQQRGGRGGQEGQQRQQQQQEGGRDVKEGQQQGQGPRRLPQQQQQQQQGVPPKGVSLKAVPPKGVSLKGVQPKGVSADEVRAAVDAWAAGNGGRAVYLTSTGGDTSALAGLVAAGARVLTGVGYGCTTQQHQRGRQQQQGVICAAVDMQVCAAAAEFAPSVGNSALALAVCGRRQDQDCKDLMGRTLADGRLLF